MKKKLIFTISSLLFAAMLLFAGCAPAEKEVVLIEYDGLSAYEIFCKNYIYIESEEQWIDDLLNGTLQRIDNSVLEEKLIGNGSIEDDFTDNEIILIIDKYFCDKTFTVEDFHMIDVTKVEQWTEGRLPLAGWFPFTPDIRAHARRAGQSQCDQSNSQNGDLRLYIRCTAESYS